MSEKLLRVTALTSGRDVPSSRFRVRQHIAELARYGIEVRESIPAVNKYAIVAPDSPLQLPLISRVAAWTVTASKIAARVPGVLRTWRTELTWLERDLVPNRFTLERVLHRPYIYDVDDAIWLRPDRGRAVNEKISRSAAAVFAGNTFIADFFSNYNDNVHIVPTAIDTDRFLPAANRVEAPLTIGWIGTSANLGFLEQIEAPIAQFIRKRRARLTIVCDQMPRLASVPPAALQFIPWNPGVEVEALQSFDIGIMPLPDDDWARGKCSFKMLQYMAVGIPSVVSPVGMNSDVLAAGKVGLPATTSDQWLGALEQLASDHALRAALGARGRQIAVDRFSVAVVAAEIARHFRNLVEWND